MDYSKLRGKIREVFGTQEAFALAMNMNYSTLSGKLNGKTAWRGDEIERACVLLGIPLEEVSLYFFCRCSLENQTI